LAKPVCQNCTFFNGREGGGGESGPDLMHSDLVTSEPCGAIIGAVVLNGRPETGMPAFKLSPRRLLSWPRSFMPRRRRPTRGRRTRGVSVSDLSKPAMSSRAKSIFNGAGTCSACHSPTGDLARVAGRYRLD